MSEEVTGSEMIDDSDRAGTAGSVGSEALVEEAASCAVVAVEVIESVVGSFGKLLAEVVAVKVFEVKAEVDGTSTTTTTTLLFPFADVVVWVLMKDSVQHSVVVNEDGIPETESDEVLEESEFAVEDSASEVDGISTTTKVLVIFPLFDAVVYVVVDKPVQNSVVVDGEIKAGSDDVR